MASWSVRGTHTNELMVISVTPEQVVTRMAQTNLLHWPPPAGKRVSELATHSEARIPEWLADTTVSPEV